MQTEATLAHNLPALRQTALAAMDKDSGKVNTAAIGNSEILVTPLVYSWSMDPLKGRAFPPWWVLGEHEEAVQWITNENYKNLVKNMQARGFKVVDAKGLTEAKFDVASLGGAARYNCDPVDKKIKNRQGESYMYVANELNCWKLPDFSAVADKFPTVGYALFPRMDSIFMYEGHAQLNGEAVIIYNVSSWVSFAFCNRSSSCDYTRINDKPLIGKLVVPAEVYVNEDQRKKNHRWALKHAIQYYGEVSNQMLNQFIGMKK